LPVESGKECKLLDGFGKIMQMFLLRFQIVLSFIGDLTDVSIVIWLNDMVCFSLCSFISLFLLAVFWLLY